MFSTPFMLKRKTKPGDLSRQDYLHCLIETYESEKTTESIFIDKLYYQKDNKLQCLVHLANFAYDPVNFDFFYSVFYNFHIHIQTKLNIVDFFIDILASQNENSAFFEHALSGLVNLSCGFLFDLLL